jgi:hypothetical protein
MKKKNLIQIFKKCNIIKLTILILLVLLIIGILLYNKKVFEAMTINIYTNKDDYEVVEENDSEECSSVTAYDDTDNFNETSNGLQGTELEETSTPETTTPETTTTPESEQQAKTLEDGTARKSASYSAAFTGPLKQTQNE